MNNVKVKRYLTPRKQQKKDTFFNAVYEYFKANMISSFLAIINSIGIVFFLIYFYNIQYIPNLDFAGLMYLLVVMTLIGLFTSILLYFFFIIPGLIWKESAGSLDNNKNKFSIISMHQESWIHFLIIYIIFSCTISMIVLSKQEFIFQFLLYILIIILTALFVCLLTTNLRCINIKQLGKFFLLYLAISFFIIFPILGTYIILPNKQDIIGAFSIFFVVGLSTNILMILDKRYSFILSVIIFFIMLFFLNPKLIPFSVMKKFHMGSFNATVVFKHDYCSILKTYEVEIFDENSISCSADIKNVLWRIGKESLLEVADKNITVPTDQIISMSWPKMKRVAKTNSSSSVPVISFEFNSTKLTTSGKEELMKQAKAFDSNTTEVTLYGCASPEGTEKFNKTLSKQRAEKISTWIKGYFANQKKNMKINVVAEGTSKHCTDANLIDELKNHRKVVLEFN